MIAEEIAVACQGVDDPDRFFSEKKADMEWAVRICNTCPLMAKCLDRQMQTEGTFPTERRFGVWGGKTPDERASAARKARRPSQSKYSRPLTVEEHMERKALYDTGLSDVEIATRTKVHPTTIGKWRELYGLPTHRPQTARDLLAERVRLIDEGWTVEQIADRQKISRATVKRFMHRLRAERKAS